jgi:hypothetical protein
MCVWAGSRCRRVTWWRPACPARPGRAGRVDAVPFLNLLPATAHPEVSATTSARLRRRCDASLGELTNSVSRRRGHSYLLGVDTLELELVPFKQDGYSSSTVHIRINGEPLAQLAKVVELPFAEAENHPSLAGDYAPLALSDFRSDSRHSLGVPIASWFEDGDTVLMGCTCGEWGCWPLTAQVEVNVATVRWSQSRNGHRDSWDLAALGSFEFERGQYLDALAVIR